MSQLEERNHATGWTYRRATHGGPPNPTVWILCPDEMLRSGTKSQLGIVRLPPLLSVALRYREAFQV